MRETRVRSLGWEDTLEKEMQPSPVFLPEELHGQRTLAEYSPWGLKESDTTERLKKQTNKQTNKQTKTFLMTSSIPHSSDSY